jgi:hypothetical protein
MPDARASLLDMSVRQNLSNLLEETALYPIAEQEVNALLQIGHFPEVIGLPEVETYSISARSTPPLPGQIGQMLDDTRAFYADILLPDVFGLRYEWRSLSQVYDISRPVIRRVR